MGSSPLSLGVGNAESLRFSKLAVVCFVLLCVVVFVGSTVKQRSMSQRVSCTQSMRRCPVLGGRAAGSGLRGIRH
jgi:hypothetical protein